MSSSMFWSALHLKREMALGIIHGLKLTDQLVKDVDRARLENWWQGRFGKDYGDELAEWMKLTVLWWKLSLLFQTQCLLSGIMNAMAVPGLEMCMGSSNHCWGSRSPVAGPILSWWYTPCSQEDQPTTCRKKITLALPGHWGSSYLTFLINIILDLDLSSLLACFLSVPSFGDLVNIWHHIASDQEIQAVMKEGRGLLPIEFIGLTVYSPGSTGFTEHLVTVFSRKPFSMLS